jgi:hypothetical protein
LHLIVLLKKDCVDRFDECRVLLATALRSLYLILLLFLTLDRATAKRFLIGLSGRSMSEIPNWIQSNMIQCRDACFAVYWIDLLFLAAKIEPEISVLPVVTHALRLPWPSSKLICFPVESAVWTSAPMLLQNAAELCKVPPDAKARHFELFFEISPDSRNPRLSLHIYLSGNLVSFGLVVFVNLRCFFQACFASCFIESSLPLDLWMKHCSMIVEALEGKNSSLTLLQPSTSHPIFCFQLVELVRIVIVCEKRNCAAPAVSCFELAERLVHVAHTDNAKSSYLKLGLSLLCSFKYFLKKKKNQCFLCFSCLEKL